MKKRETHIVQGMSRDMAVSQFSPNMVYDARNIRITAQRGDNTLLSVTNEKGTAKISVAGIKGVVLGSAVLNEVLILFTLEGTGASAKGRIFKFVFNTTYTTGTLYTLYEGTGDDCLFSTDTPLETLAVYENESIQKVYWVDGVHQPRVINVAGNDRITNPDVFNFNRKIGADYKMEIEKYNSGGEFPAGTVQYCFNYFNKFGQETNIVDVSPLYYLSPKDRGLPADAISNASFLISLSGLDHNYEYVRLYAIIRTSENATPNVRIVGDFSINTLRYIDSAAYESSDVVVDYDDLYILNIDTGSTRKLTEAERPEEGAYTSLPLSKEEYLYDISTHKAYYFYTSPEAYHTSGVYIKLPYINVWNLSGVYTLRSTRAGDLFVGDYVEEEQRVTVVDNGVIGSTIDASALLFIGGEDIVAGTLTSKDTTLFLGNIKQNVPNVGSIPLIGTSTLKNLIKDEVDVSSCGFDSEGNVVTQFELNEGADVVSGDSFYEYPIDNNRSSYDIKSFKAREGYRLGLIAQYNTGQWSEVLWLGDYDEEFSPGTHIFLKEDDTVKWGVSYHKPGFKAFIPQSVCTALKNNGFIRIAPVVVYPNISDRRVFCQGIIASTVYNVQDRSTNSPFAQADWRFRMGYDWNNIEDEIQTNYGPRHLIYPTGRGVNSGDTVETLSPENFVKAFSTEYYRDSNILTFHSPDLQEDSEQYHFSLGDYKLRIVGITNGGFDVNKDVIIPKSKVASFIETSDTGISEESRVINEGSVGYAESLMVPRYEDIPVLISENDDWGETTGSLLRKWYVYYPDPYNSADQFGSRAQADSNVHHGTTMYKWYNYIWHRSGSLNNQDRLSTKARSYNTRRTATFSKKCISELKYGITTFFQNSALNTSQNLNAVPNDTPFTDVAIENTTLAYGNVDSVVQLKSSGNLYYPKIDKVLVPNYNSPTGIEGMLALEPTQIHWWYNEYGYPIGFDSYYLLDDDTTPPDTMPHYATEIYYGTEVNPSLRGFFGNDPVSIKYSTTPHIVFNLASGTDEIKTLGTFGGLDTYNAELFWKNNNQVTVNGESIDASIYTGFSGINSSLYIGELYREFSDERNASRFGGSSDAAIENNIWTRCGESVSLETQGAGAYLYYREGDTYIGRYDFLKTYPSTNEDVNQFVSIYSTEIESRVNLDARYDKNRGLIDNMYIRPNNFNLFNHPGYEQTNQYFTYKAIDYTRYKSLRHPTMLTWSLEKKPGADIDAWTSIPLTSTADVQGELGEITKLIAFNDSLYSFQNKGIAQVLFNERVQISTGDGQPIEITNGMKFGGFRYLTNQIGLTNKWSLCATPNGMYFIDDEKNTIYQFNGQQFQDLSTKHGFRTWLYKNNSYDVWTPNAYKNIRTFYDKVEGDVYFTTKTESLVYSEQLGAFMSFMDYAKLPFMVNVNDKLITLQTTTGTEYLYRMHEGDYNMFLTSYKPYWLTFVSNSDPTVDKTYDNLAWRTICYNNAGTVLEPLITFDSLRVWNNYQDTGEVALIDTPGKPSPLKKKFNVFRALVPRDTITTWGNTNGMNRIRNTWTYIKLMKTVTSPVTDERRYKMQFFDLDVDFFE